MIFFSCEQASRADFSGGEVKRTIPISEFAVVLGCAGVNAALWLFIANACLGELGLVLSCGLFGAVVLITAFGLAFFAGLCRD